ncbi:MAG TPA: DUF1003 domain-containing protein [Bryobacteraceae bacterium]
MNPKTPQQPVTAHPPDEDPRGKRRAKFKAPETLPASANIASVAQLEREFLGNRTWVERLGDAVGSFVGSMTFVVLHVCLFTLWFLVNTRTIPGLPVFDPFPFIFLNLAVSVETVLLSTFVLIKQNRESRRADRRGELNLQVDLLAEKEATKMLQLLQRICDHLGIDAAKLDPEVKALSQDTAVRDIAEELTQKMPPQ